MVSPNYLELNVTFLRTCIDNKPIHYRNWSSAGIYFVRDFLEEDSQFLTFDTIKDKFAIKAHSTVPRRHRCHLECKTQKPLSVNERC